MSLLDAAVIRLINGHFLFTKRFKLLGAYFGIKLGEISRKTHIEFSRSELTCVESENRMLQEGNFHVDEARLIR